MRMNRDMSRLLGDVDVSHLSVSDVPEAFTAIVAQGWREHDGVWVLKALSEGCSGDASLFTDAVHAETTVNGRGMIDYDLPVGRVDRRVPLMQRSLAYACAAIRSVGELPESPAIMAYVTVSERADESGLESSHVTFCASRQDVPPYVPDVGEYKEGALLELSPDDDLVRSFLVEDGLT